MARSVDVVKGKGLCCSVSHGVRKLMASKPPSTSASTLSYRARKIYVEKHGEPVCRICEKVPADVHHKDGNRMNNADENHDPLCRSCHVALENHLFPKRWKISPMKAEIAVADAECDSPPPPPTNLTGVRSFDVTRKDAGGGR